MGRETFVPLQMRLTLVLFTVLSLVLLAALAVTALYQPLASPAMATAALAFFGVVVNRFVLVPRALRAGGRTRREVKGKDHEASVTGFAADGVGTGTQLYHRLVVLFVVVMLGGVVSHAFAVSGAC
jgi:hypothetical protein